MKYNELRNNLNFRLIAPALFICLIVPFISNAQGDLLITPRRVVFEGNRQRQDITLANTGTETASYSISFIQYYMTDDGAFETVEEPRPGQMFADQYLRFFPRSVTLEPGESQVVRMQLRRLPGMADGEYRSHIYFRAVPDERPLGEGSEDDDDTGIGIRITPIFGITIPAIIRVGQVSAKISLSNIKLNIEEGNPPLLQMALNREGNQSVYGDLSVDYIPEGGKPINVGNVRGLAIYTPNQIRNFSMQLETHEEIDYNKGKLILRYISSNDAKPEVFTEKEFEL